MRRFAGALTVLAATSGVAAPEVFVRGDVQEYRRIRVDVEMAHDAGRRAVQIWFAVEPFTDLAAAELHSVIRIGPTADLERTPTEEALDACWSDDRPIHRDDGGGPVLAPDATRFSCALSGMMPGVVHWIAVVGVDGDGVPRHPVRMVQGRTDALDERTPDADTRPILFALGAILLSLVALFAGLRWRDAAIGQRGGGLAHWYIAPAALALALLTFYPVGFGVFLAFTDAHQTRLGDQRLIGFGNFATLLTSPGVGRVTFFTLLWAVVNVAAHLGLGLLLAVALNRPGLTARSAYRTLLLLPWAIPGYISVLAWRGMLAPDGLLNAMLGTEVDWLTQPGSARLLVILVNIWLGTPFMMMALTGALQSVPKEMVEAAQVDGVSRARQFLHLTLPSLKSTLVPLSLLGFIWTINSFHVIFLMTRGGPYVGFGEPGATDILVTYVYDVAFDYGNYGVAAAWSVAIFVVLLAFSWVYLKRTRATEAIA